MELLLFTRKVHQECQWSAVSCVEKKETASLSSVHSDRYKTSEKKWCRALGFCTTIGSFLPSQNASFLLGDDGEGWFNVKMRRLEMKDTCWYWCVAGHLNAPVYIIVTKRTNGRIYCIYKHSNYKYI